MAPKRHRVLLTQEAIDMLRQVGKVYGQKTYGILRDLTSGLELEPERKGVPLRPPLEGMYSLHYSRFRIIYRIHKDELEVLVIGAGDRRPGAPNDIYQIIERLVESGTIVLRPPDEQE